MDDQTLFVVVAVLGSLVGYVVSVAWPFARKYFSGEAEKFEWRKVGLRLLVGFGAVLTTFTSVSGLAKIQELAEQQWIGFGLAVLYGFFTLGASSLGHQLQSTPKAVRAWKDGRHQ
jgi:H+/Cl- antiporter ClcA